MNHVILWSLCKACSSKQIGVLTRKSDVCKTLRKIAGGGLIDYRLFRLLLLVVGIHDLETGFLSFPSLKPDHSFPAKQT